MKIKYKRILLKMSGEVLKGPLAGGVDFETVREFAEVIKSLKKLGVEVGIVIGGGNIWRYRNFSKELNRVVSDTLGMMATNMNAMVFESILLGAGVKAKALTSYPVKGVETYTVKKGRDYMKKGFVVIFGGGTGEPMYTTDSAAALRARDMKCDIVMKATKVDYVYDKDPVKFKNAKKFETLSFDEVIRRKLEIMDLTCAKILKKAKIPMLVFNLNRKGVVEKAVKGEKIGTLIT